MPKELITCHPPEVFQPVENRVSQDVIVCEGIIEREEDGYDGEGYESKQPRADECIPGGIFHQGSGTSVDVLHGDSLKYTGRPAKAGLPANMRVSYLRI
ncbi:hypothetical protein SDC9_45472 [bioreactor metagenome]|uniref:Uncharacterized protein n=1 Tax=bioreactor metagenome TaxID=1076179 RepID=A0A644W655_9ZZZZ